ncbi:MAG: hypothetical protein ABGX17_05685 [Desulfurobacteriaceae bacterium]
MFLHAEQPLHERFDFTNFSIVAADIAPTSKINRVSMSSLL